MLIMQHSTLTMMHAELDALWLRRFLGQKKVLTQPPGLSK